MRESYQSTRWKKFLFLEFWYLWRRLLFSALNEQIAYSFLKLNVTGSIGLDRISIIDAIIVKNFYGSKCGSQNISLVAPIMIFYNEETWVAIRSVWLLGAVTCNQSLWCPLFLGARMTMGYQFRPLKSIVTRAPTRRISALVNAERYLNAVSRRRQIRFFCDFFAQF